jgi:4-hydroxybenzoyl-CoA thioesterase
MTFRTRITVRFGDEDHAGVVYFPRFFHFFHCAFEDFFNAHAMPYQQVLDEDGTGWPAVRTECDFAKPLKFGDVLEIEVWVERLGTKSATFAYRGTRLADGEEVARARITVACIDMQSFRGKPIPTRYRELFAKYLDASE